MQKYTTNLVVVKPATRSKLRYKKDNEIVTKKTTVSNESLPSDIGVSFNSKDELKEHKVLSFKEFI